jgi:large subunit ribosomal protein L23
MKDPRKIILRPVVTEKSLEDQEVKRYCFEVDKRANKDEIKRAIEQIFDVRVISVQTLNKRGKLRRQRYKVGRRRGWKKAFIRLDPEHTIEII